MEISIFKNSIPQVLKYFTTKFIALSDAKLFVSFLFACNQFTLNQFELHKVSPKNKLLIRQVVVVVVAAVVLGQIGDNTRDK